MTQERSLLLSVLAIAAAGFNALMFVLALSQSNTTLAVVGAVVAGFWIITYQRNVVGPIGLTLLSIGFGLYSVSEVANPASKLGTVVGVVLGLAVLWGAWLRDERIAKIAEQARLDEVREAARARAKEQERLKKERRAREAAEAKVADRAASERLQAEQAGAKANEARRIEQLERELAEAKEEARRAKEEAQAAKRGGAAPPNERVP
jgi:uncharacterized membrane protein YccC